MKKIIFIIFIFNTFFLSCFSQQFTIGKKEVLFPGKFHLHSIMDLTTPGETKFIPFKQDGSFIEVSSNGLTISINSVIVHQFSFFSMPRTGIEYIWYDEVHDVELKVLPVTSKVNDEVHFGFLFSYPDSSHIAYTYNYNAKYIFSSDKSDTTPVSS